MSDRIDIHDTSRRAFLGTGIAAAGLTAAGLGGVASAGATPLSPVLSRTLLDAVGPEALPPLTTGAQLLSACWHDAAPTTAGATLGHTTFDGDSLGSYASPAGNLGIDFHLPAGSTVARVDVYLYRPVFGNVLVALTNVDVTTGDVTSVGSRLESGSGRMTSSWTPGTSIAAGRVLHVEVATSPANAFFVGAICQYLPITTQFAPTTPARVYDSRWPASSGVPVGPLTGPSFRYVSVADQRNLDTGAVVGTVVPAGTRAIAYNLTITGTTGSGYLTVNPGGVTTIGSSTINWSGPGVTLANASVVAVSSLRAITLVAPAGCSTHAVVDVNGFFL